MIEALLKGLAIGLLLMFSVGPVVFSIIKQSINNGTVGGLSFVAGVWLSDVVWVILSNAFSELMTYLLHFKMQIGIGGSCLLIALGIFYLLFKKVEIQDAETPIRINRRDHAKLVLSGFLINSLNPAVLLFWLTTATALAASHSLLHRLVIFGTCLVFNATVDVLKVLLAGKLRTKLTAPNIRWINRISGIILLAFGIVLLLGMLYPGSTVMPAGMHP